MTDVFEDARQPRWSPDGKWMTYFSFRDGGYDLWSIAPDGTGQHRLTWGPFDDREPIVVARRHPCRVLVGSREPARQRLQHLDARRSHWRLAAADEGAVRRLHAVVVARRSRDSLRVNSRKRPVGLGRIVADLSQRKLVTVAAGRVDAPSWGPGGQIVYHLTGSGQSRYEIDGKPITGSENVFAFRAAWASPTDVFYVSDGKIRRRTLAVAEPRTVDFSAAFQVTQPQYTRRVRDFTSTKPRKALGIVRPVLSPDGQQIAFAAVGDIYVVSTTGGKPVNLTNDAALDTDPAWSPDGGRLVYSSDKNSAHLQLWIRDMKSGEARQVTRLATQPQGASFSPDGKRVVFFNVDGMWRVAQMSVLDVASGQVTTIHDTLPQPGTPTWSPDGRRVALASVAPMSTRFREGTNQVLTILTEPATPEGIRKRKTWATNGMFRCRFCRSTLAAAAVPSGRPTAARWPRSTRERLSVWPVAKNGAPLGPPRRVTSESAHAPSWQGDSRHILYQSLDTLRILDLESGETRTVPLDLQWTPAIPTGRLVIHAGRLLDMTAPTPRSNVDVIVEGNRIARVVPHADANHSGGRVVDASQQTVMPGLVEFHSHLQKDFGAAQGRAWLAFGVTTVRSPGNTPYEAVEDREANEAGVRPGPRVYGTGYLMEWGRVYYKMGIAISSVAQFEMELQRAKVLEHDLIKSYVRLPDAQQKRMVEFAHSIGVPVATHEIFPAALVGVDNTEHTAATSRRGYSPKMATLQRAYEDVVQLFGKSGRIFCPMISGGGSRQLFETDPALKSDPRFTLYPQWIQRQVAQQPTAAAPVGAAIPPAAAAGWCSTS